MHRVDNEQQTMVVYAEDGTRLSAVLRALIEHHLGPDVDHAARHLAMLLDLIEKSPYPLDPYAARDLPDL